VKLLVDLRGRLLAPLRARLAFALASNLAMVAALAAFLTMVILGQIVDRSFSRLEAQEVERSVRQVDRELTRRLENISARSRDWGFWDDSYAFLQTFSDPFIRSNIDPASLSNAQVDCVAFLRFSGTGARSFCFDRESGNADPVLASELLAATRSPAIRSGLKAQLSVATYLRVDGQIMAVAATQVLRSNRTGEPIGYIVFAEKVNAQTLNAALQLNGQLLPAGGQDRPFVDYQAEMSRISLPILSHTGEPVSRFTYGLKRELAAAGRRLRNLMLFATAALLVSLFVILWYRLNKLVSEPIRAFHSHVAHIRQTGELSEVAELDRRDEIGDLQREFNAMASELFALRIKTEAQSFALGRHQSSAVVMHNLRNSLTPAPVILTGIEARLAGMFPAHRSAALGELEHPELAAERRIRLLAYLQAADHDLQAGIEECRALTQEATRVLGTAIQSLASSTDDPRPDFDETCDLAVLAEQAASVARFSEGVAIAISFRFEQRPLARGNRVLLGQVLENLAINAAEAIRATGRDNGNLSISVRPSDRPDFCRIEFRDDGEGIAGEHVAQVFDRGFSTRLAKSGGLGLHWCSNIVNLMGGAIDIISEGPGCGATAIVELPIVHASRDLSRQYSLTREAAIAVPAC